MNILGIIPARAGSKRIPDKNIKSLGGKPLAQHIIEAGLKSKKITHLVVSSDSDAVLKISSNYSNIISIRRPAELASDISPAIEYVKHTLNYLKSELSLEFQIIVILQPTSPLTLAEDIDNTIEKLINTKAETTVSVVEVSQMVNPLKLKKLVGDKLLPYMEEENGKMAFQDLPKVYVRNCAVYATTIDVVNRGEIIGKDCRAYIMPQSRSIDINDPLDFEFAEFLYEKYHR